MKSPQEASKDREGWKPQTPLGWFVATVVAAGVTAGGTLVVQTVTRGPENPSPPQTTTIVNNLGPALDEVSKQVAAASSNGSVATPALQEIIDECRDDTVRKYEVFTADVAEEFCGAMVAAVANDRELSAEERADIRGIVLVPFCVQTLLDLYDEGNAELGETLLAFDRDQLKDEAPLMCETTFSDELVADE